MVDTNMEAQIQTAMEIVPKKYAEKKVDRVIKKILKDQKVGVYGCEYTIDFGKRIKPMSKELLHNVPGYKKALRNLRLMHIFSFALAKDDRKDIKHTLDQSSRSMQMALEQATTSTLFEALIKNNIKTGKFDVKNNVIKFTTK